MSFQVPAKKYLSSLNPILLVLIMYLTSIFFSVTQPMLGGVLVGFDILLPIVSYLGQRRQTVEGIFLVFLGTQFITLSSTAPVGILFFCYLAVFFVAKKMSRWVYAEKLGAILGMLCVVYVVKRISLLLLMNLFFEGGVAWVHFSGFLVTLFGGYILYELMDLLDKLTLRKPAEFFRLQ